MFATVNERAAKNNNCHEKGSAKSNLNFSPKSMGSTVVFIFVRDLAEIGTMNNHINDDCTALLVLKFRTKDHRSELQKLSFKVHFLFLVIKKSRFPANFYLWGCEAIPHQVVVVVKFCL
jgi:hypothetical protein